MHSNSYQLVRAFAVVIRDVPKSIHIICIGCGRGAKNISTKQYRLRQYKVTTINLLEKTTPYKNIPIFSQTYQN